jgi:hypothetical protein
MGRAGVQFSVFSFQHSVSGVWKDAVFLSAAVLNPET